MRILVVLAVLGLTACPSGDETDVMRDADAGVQADVGAPGADAQPVTPQTDAQPGMAPDTATAPRQDASAADTRPQGPQPDTRPADTLMMSLIPPSQVTMARPGAPACVIPGTQCPMGQDRRYECCGSTANPPTGACQQFGPKLEDYGCCSTVAGTTCQNDYGCCGSLRCKMGANGIKACG